MISSLASTGWKFRSRIRCRKPGLWLSVDRPNKNIERNTTLKEVVYPKDEIADDQYVQNIPDTNVNEADIEHNT